MRNVAVLAAVLLAAVLGIALLSVVHSPAGQPAAVASSTATATATPAPSAATPSPSPTTFVYVNRTYGFSVTLPAPYRKSARLSGSSTTSGPVAFDGFTARTVEDETPLPGACDATCPLHNYVASVEVSTGVSQTPREWYTARASAAGQRIDDVTVDGRPAIRVTNGAEIYVPVQLIVKDGDRMFRIGYQITRDPVPAGASHDKLDQILASFKFVP